MSASAKPAAKHAEGDCRHAGSNPRTPRGTMGMLYDSRKHGTLEHQPGDRRSRAERRNGAREAGKQLRAIARGARGA
jgi:hypothetical protein